MARLLKLTATTLFTLGFVVSPHPDALLSEHSTVVLDSSERIALRKLAPVSAASAKAPLDFSLDALPLNSVVPDPSLAPPLNKATFLENSPTEISANPSSSLEGAEAERFRRVMQYALDRVLFTRSLGDIIQAIATQFWGSRYQANLLDQSQRETLFVSLSQFDCVLFVETMLALAHNIAIRDDSIQGFVANLQDQRYRDGKRDGYCSRLHYFSEWILDNQKRGRLVDVAARLGGVSLNKSLNFMSNHRHNYPRLINDDAAYQCVQQMEARLSPLSITYIPPHQVRQVYPHLQPGDVIAIASNIPGLDVTHTGLAYRNTDGSIGMIHAAPTVGVMISPDLQTYVNNAEGAIGILIARPVDPRMTGSKP